jgi:hypothetical protein
MITELHETRLVLQRTLLRLLNLAWPGATGINLVVEPPRLADAVQRITEGLTQKDFSEQIYNVVIRFFWDICKAMDDKHPVLFQKISALQKFESHEIDGADMKELKDKLNDITFCRRTFRSLETEFDLKMKLSPFQQPLIDNAGQDIESDFGSFAQKCVDLAMHKDPRTFLSVDTAEVFLQALQIAAMGSKLSGLLAQIKQCIQNVDDFRAEFNEAREALFRLPQE